MSKVPATRLLATQEAPKAGKQATRPRIVAKARRTTEIEAVAESFYLDRQAARRSDSTLIWYRKYIGALVTHLAEQGLERFAEVRSDHIRAWLVSLQERELADRTIRHHIRAARTFFQYAIDEEWLSEGKNPAAKVAMPTEPKEVLPTFTPDDVERLLKACESERDKAVVLCLLDTGCRAAEFVAINLGDVNLKEGTILVRMGKGKKGRVVFLVGRSRKALIRYLG